MEVACAGPARDFSCRRNARINGRAHISSMITIAKAPKCNRPHEHEKGPVNLPFNRLRPDPYVRRAELTVENRLAGFVNRVSLQREFSPTNLTALIGSKFFLNFWGGSCQTMGDHPYPHGLLQKRRQLGSSGRTL